MSTERDHDFLHAVDTTLHAILSKLDGFDPDELEADLASGVLRITFGDGRTCIVNRQAAANQIWLAEGASAWHFTREGGRWMDTKGRGRLEEVLAEVLTRRLGKAVRL